MRTVRPEQIGAILALIAGIIMATLVPDPADAAPVPLRPMTYPVMRKERPLLPQFAGHADPKHIEVDEVPIPGPPAPPFVGQQRAVRAPFLPPMQRRRVFHTVVSPAAPPVPQPVRASQSSYLQYAQAALAMQRARGRAYRTVAPPTPAVPSHSSWRRELVPK